MYVPYMAKREELKDAQWAAIQLLLPKPFLRADGNGRPRRSDRSMTDGILWILRTGARWCGMPERFPPSQTYHRRCEE